MASIVELYRPSAVQAEAHACRADEILYGGTAGCGKTLWLRWDPIITQWHGEHERWKADPKHFRSTGWVLHVRRTFPMLLQTIIYMKDVAAKLDPGVHWDGDAKMLTFSCGFRYQFGHLQHEEDWRDYDSQDYTGLYIDEAIQLLKVQFDMLSARVRSTDPVLGKKLRICLASNPDAPFEGLWVKERYVDPAPEGRTLLREVMTLEDGTEMPVTALYIPARLSDNPDIDYRRRYEARLRRLPHHIMKARLEGNWDTVEGAFFEYEWIPDIHIVDPFPIPSHFTVFRTMDWGYRSPAPILYWAKDEEGNLIVIDELNFNFKVQEQDRKDAELVAIAQKRYEQAHGYWDDYRNCSRLTGPADYQIKERRGQSGPTIEQDFASYGIYWEPCKKNRYQATQELLRRLKDVPKRGRPGLTVFRTCKETCRTIPLIPTAPLEAGNPHGEQVPKDGGEDHWLDNLFYGVMYSAPNADKKRQMSNDDFAIDQLARAREKKLSRWGYGL